MPKRLKITEKRNNQKILDGKLDFSNKFGYTKLTILRHVKKYWKEMFNNLKNIKPLVDKISEKEVKINNVFEK